MIIKRLIYLVVFILGFLLFDACSGNGSNSDNSESKSQNNTTSKPDSDNPLNNKGIGPVKSVTLGQLDESMADEGAKIYQAKCTACHKPEEKFIGPAPKGILDRRSPEWIMNMILNPEVMIKNDPIAKQLLVEFNLAPMANQHLTQEEARKVLEYFRTLK